MAKLGKLPPPLRLPREGGREGETGKKGRRRRKVKGQVGKEGRKDMLVG